MGTPDEGGPDGSSLMPVSSLRSRFENMGKAIDQPPTLPPSQPRTPARTTSPAPVPKPEKLRDTNAIHRDPPAIPKSKPDLHPQHSPSPQRSVFPPPPLTPRPPVPPSLLIQPPQSPPKGRNLNIATNEQPAFLNPDDLVKPASPSPSVPGKQFKIPSRPHTPSLDPRRSPRIPALNKPPSPPPPRRSAELRRQRESEAAPPPVNRADKPLIRSNRNSWAVADGRQIRQARSFGPEKVSPFSSPPSSGSASADEDSPPTLPTRPRPRPEEPVAQAKILQLGFEPPPIHHSIVSRRKGRESELNGAARGQLTPDVTGESRPTLPARPQSTIIEKSSTRFDVMPPPRPPRPALSAAMSAVGASVPGKRTVSTPVSQHPPPPQRIIHGRSNTVSHRGADRPSHDSRMPSMVVAQTPELQGADSTVAPTPKPTEAGGPLTTSYPDSSNTNRRPPYIKYGVHEINTKYDARIFDVCGDLVCTTGHLTRVWSVRDGELLMSFAHGEGVKASAVSFKPGANVDEEGKRLWIGNSNGDLMEADIATQNLVCTKPAVHGRNEVIRIYRHFNELWTLDETGTLYVWGPREEAVPDMTQPHHQTFRVPKGHTFSMVVGDELWYAVGKEIRIFLPTLDGKAQFQVLLRSLVQEGAGEVTSGTLTTTDPDRVFFGHSDGKVSVYSTKDHSCLALLNTSAYKINTLQAAGSHMWAGFNTGKICVYDTTQTPWVVKKDWQAHDNPVVKIIADRSSFYTLDRHQVVSLGADNMVRVWDGLLQDDWLEAEMKAKDASYCEFQDMKMLLMTWNAGASTPNSLRYSESDAAFIQKLLQTSDSPDIIVFGFQELVDLEDKTATAKRFLKPKKKDGSDQERMSHQYRDWRDFLTRSLDDYMSGDLYHLLQTAHLVGLFTCVFVKADVRSRVSNLSTAEVKRGMGGLHGNKGAIAVRFMIDDTSLCFINCHLAAGQSQATHRHNDIAAILEAQILPVERDPSVRIDSYTGGGDGSMILDHELCVLNGDLNYRIDTMSRDTVVMAVKQGNLAKLLDRDQLLVARRRNPGFRLRAFEEMPITFAPTYKYDVGTDNYDTSEKKRSPAWCDRILFRGRGRIQQMDYRRHEVRVSDHRPVTGKLKLTVKKISPKRRAMAWMECQQTLEDVKERVAQREKLYYLTQVIGYDVTTSKGILRDRLS